MEEEDNLQPIYPSPFMKDFLETGETNYDTYFSQDSRFIPFDYTNQDYLTGHENPFEQNIYEMQAQRQPWLAKSGTLVARAGAKAISEVLKMPGVVGGSLAAPFQEEGQGWEMALNNAWIKSVDETAKDFNEEALPVYVRKAVKEGNLGDNIFSIDFWATEGADGIGYFASMFAPGQFLKAINFGGKTFKGIKGISKAAGLGNKLDDVANVLKAAGINPKSFELGTQTIANTLFEAAAEAKGAGDAYMQRIQEDLASGAIDEEAANQRKAELMRNVFVSNVAILMGPNAIMSKMLWGSKNLGKIAGKFMKKGAIAEATKRTGWQNLGRFGKHTIPGATSEGLEEGMQATSEGFFTEEAIEGKTGGWLDGQRSLASNLVESYIDTMSETEGQKATFLGAFLGGGMSGVHGRMSDKAEEKRTETLIGKLKDLESFHKVFTDDVYNEDGKLDKTRALQKLEALSTSEELGSILTKALEENDTKTLDELRAFASGELIKSYIINDEVGIDALNQYLDSSTTIKDMATKEKKEIKDIINPIKERAAKLKKDNDLFEQFGESFMTVEGENIKKEDRINYLDYKRSIYLTKKNLEYFVNDKLDKKEVSRTNFINSLGYERGFKEGQYTDIAKKEIAEKEGKSNIALQTLNEEITELKKQSEALHTDINNFWNPKNSKQELERFKNVRETLEETEKEEKEITALKKEIDRATTVEEIKAIGKGKSISNDALDAYKQSRIAEIEKEKFKKKKATITQQEKSSEETTLEQEAIVETQTEILNEKMPDSIMGEASVITAELLAQSDQPTRTDLIGKDIIINSYVGNTIVFMVPEDGTMLTVVEKSKPKPKPISEPATVDDNQTEGADNHDELAEDLNKSISNTSAGGANGSKLISTNEKTGKKFDFVDASYLEAERTPVDKRGREVGFSVGKEIPIKGLSGTQKKQTMLINKALTQFKKEGITDKNISFLIDYLPLNGMLSDTIGAPMFTKPATAASVKIFNKGSRILRTNILNAMKDGVKIADIKTVIEGQYGGTITIAPLERGMIPENNITGLQYLQSLSKAKLMAYIQDNIGFVNKHGQIELADSSTFTMSSLKEKAKGEIYLLLPSANGTRTPLKLNIKRLEGDKADLLADIVEMRFKDTDIKKSTVIAEIKDAAFVQKIQDTFSKELKLIGKRFNDITLKDIVDFMVYDNTTNTKTQMRFRGTGAKGSAVFIYGNPKLDGKAELTSQEFDKEHFKTWLKNNKRHNITLRENDRNKASIFGNIDYLGYLINEGILNTNAVVGVDSNGRPNPTFQGRTDIYLSSELNKKSDKKIRKSQNNFVPSHEVENTPQEKKNKTIKKSKTVTDTADITNTDLKNIVKELMTRKLLKGGSVLMKIISNVKLSNKEKVTKMKETLGENTMLEIIKKCKG